jgi:hypothetical protein
MIHADCYVGMRVYFGRGQGQKTLGVVEKLNPTKAKVRTLEERGNGRASGVGVVWSVPYSMMAAAPGEQNRTTHVAPRREEPIPQFLGGVEYHVMMAISCCYSGLSPENLSCDGEASMSHMQAVGSRLRRQLRALEQILGRSVSESAACEWHMKQLNRTSA